MIYINYTTIMSFHGPFLKRSKLPNCSWRTRTSDNSQEWTEHWRGWSSVQASKGGEVHRGTVDSIVLYYPKDPITF